MLKQYNDYELIYMAQERNEEAIDILYRKYQPLIKRISTYYYKKSINTSLELKDITQECQIALMNAIQSFNEKENSVFYTFAKKCIKNSIISLIRKETNEKNKFYNNTISLNNIIDKEEQQEIIDLIENDKVTNPEIELIQEEEQKLLLTKIINHLSPLEECVLILKIQNFNYKEISAILDKDEKSIDNSLQRIRKKIENIKLLINIHDKI